ncbi:MAG: undecaprenyl-diphosphatase [Burkholderiaceae bacterium]
MMLNAPAHPNVESLKAAMVIAEYIPWMLPCVLVAGWLICQQSTRKTLVQAAVAGLLGVACNQVIIQMWPTPRPFMLGVGHTYLTHGADASFPSDHLTLWWAVALSMTMGSSTRIVGLGLVLLGIPIAWARVYLGVHFPIDMLGALAVAALSAWICQLSRKLWIDPATALITRCYAIVFAPFVRRGWLPV